MDRKRNYYEDIRLFDTLPKTLWILLVGLGLVLSPFYLGNYHLYLIGYTSINIIVALGLNLLVGYTGQISMGHAGFFAIGAYGTAMVANAGWPIIPALIAAGLIAAFFGFLLGIPALRLEGPYLAVVTLGFGLTIETVFAKWHIFGGATGPSVPKFTLSFFPGFSTEQNLYVMIMLSAALSLLAVRNLVRTRVGRAFIAIRDSDVAASSVGVNLTYFKTLSFAVSAFFTGVAGGLFALHLGQIDPTSYNLMMSILFLSMVVIGGVGSILGPVMGAILISVLNMKLKGLRLADFAAIPWFGDEIRAFLSAHFMETGMGNIRFIVYGLILIFIMVFEPLGLYGIWIRTKRYWRTWPF